MLHRDKRRIGAVCAIAGSALLVVGTYLHPVPTDPNDAVAAFTEYAADQLWIASHLMQLAGVTLMLVALIVLAQLQEVRAGAVWYSVASGGAIACLAVATALQAVDGIALKRIVNVWLTAPIAQKGAAFYAALAVRQVEVGLASTLSLLLGLTVTLYGLAMLGDGAFPRWLAGLAVLGGTATAVSGVVMAYTAFSALEMMISMPASWVLLLWIVMTGVWMWRSGEG